jgi:hypothetical protein
MGAVESKSVSDTSKSVEAILVAAQPRLFAAFTGIPSFTTKADYSDAAANGAVVTTLTSSLPNRRAELERSFVLMKQLRHPNVFHYLRHTSWTGKMCSVTGLPVALLSYSTSRRPAGSSDAQSCDPQLAVSPEFLAQATSEVIYGMTGIVDAAKVLTGAKLLVKRLHWSHILVSSLQQPLSSTLPARRSGAVHFGRWLLGDLTQISAASSVAEAAVVNGASLALFILDVLALLLNSPRHRAEVIGVVRRLCGSWAKSEDTNPETLEHAELDGNKNKKSSVDDGADDRGVSAVELDVAETNSLFDALLAALRAATPPAMDPKNPPPPQTTQTACGDEKDDDRAPGASQSSVEPTAATAETVTSPRSPVASAWYSGDCPSEADASRAGARPACEKPLLRLFDWLFARISGGVAFDPSAGNEEGGGGDLLPASIFDSLRDILVNGLQDPLTVCLNQGAQLHLFYSTDVYEANKLHFAATQEPTELSTQLNSALASEAAVDSPVSRLAPGVASQSQLAGAYATILSAVKAMHEQAACDDGGDALFERRVAPWLLDVSHMVQHDAHDLFPYILGTLSSFRPILRPELQKSLLSTVAARMLVTSKDTVARVNGLRSLQLVIQFLPTCVLCPDFIALAGFTMFQARVRFLELLEKTRAAAGGVADHLHDDVVFLCRASRAYVRHLHTVEAEIAARAARKELASGTAAAVLYHELLFKEAVLLAVTMTSAENSLLQNHPQLFSEALRVARAVVLALVASLKAALTPFLRLSRTCEDLRQMPTVSGAVYTISHLMYYGSVEIREMTINLLLALCTAERAAADEEPNAPRDSSRRCGVPRAEPTFVLTWQTITQWWLPLASPLAGVREERLRGPACQLAALLVGCLPVIGPPTPTPSEAAASGGASFAFPSHLGCIAAYEAMLNSRPYSVDGSAGNNLQAVFAGQLQKSILGPLYTELRRVLPNASSAGVDEATGAVLALRSKDVGDAWVRDGCNGPLKLVSAANDAAGGEDSVLLPPPLI